jgi:S-DNA-T family DNA segregation ATPase FtsK/SpoIIIE
MTRQQRRRIYGDGYLVSTARDWLGPPIVRPVWSPPWWLIGLGMLGHAAVRTVAFAIRHLILLAVAVGMSFAVVVLGWRTAGISALIGIAALGAWAFAHPASFATAVGWPVSAAWRRFWIYRRHWQPMMATLELTVSTATAEYLPVLKRVQTAGHVDRVLVAPLPGQDPALWQQHAAQLAYAFGAMHCAVFPAPRGHLWLEFTRRNPRRTTQAYGPAPRTQ